MPIREGAVQLTVEHCSNWVIPSSVSLSERSESLIDSSIVFTSKHSGKGITPSVEIYSVVRRLLDFRHFATQRYFRIAFGW